MQEKWFEHDMADVLSAEHINWNEKFINWAKSHLDLCDGYVQEKNDDTRLKLRKRIEHSMHYGHQILSSMTRDAHSKKDKGVIPLSGMNRFAKANDMQATHDGGWKNRKTTKNDSKETLDSRKPCLPSKTYIKKKEN